MISLVKNFPKGMVKMKNMWYNKRTLFYYPKLYYSTYSPEKTTVELNAVETNLTNGKFNGNLYKYLDEIVDSNDSNIIS